MLTIVAERRNSPFSGRPSTSSRTVCSRSPCATAVIARVTAVVGHSRSSISVLTELSISPQAPCDSRELDALAGLALAPDDLADMLELLRHALVGRDDLVEGVGDLAGEAGPVARQPHREVADPHRLQRVQQLVAGRSRSPPITISAWPFAPFEASAAIGVVQSPGRRCEDRR